MRELSWAKSPGHMSRQRSSSPRSMRCPPLLAMAPMDDLARDLWAPTTVMEPGKCVWTNTRTPVGGYVEVSLPEMAR